MKRKIKADKAIEIKATPYPKGDERKFEKFMQDMTRAMVQQYKNETFKKLNKKTIEKFEDAQVGNWAAIFTGLSNKAKRKIKKRFSDDRIKKKVKDLLTSMNKRSQVEMYANIEDQIGISSAQLIATEGLTPQYNALIEETFEWTVRNVEESLADFSANTLRLMAEGGTIEEVEKGFLQVAKKRVESSKFVARNQIANFNSLTGKIRAQNLGITHATWQTAEDERVRPCHAVRNDKVFELSEGLYSSCDGKTLLPGTDYNCRCISRYIIPGDEDYSPSFHASYVFSPVDITTLSALIIAS